MKATKVNVCLEPSFKVEAEEIDASVTEEVKIQSDAPEVIPTGEVTTQDAVTGEEIRTLLVVGWPEQGSRNGGMPPSEQEVYNFFRWFGGLEDLVITHNKRDNSTMVFAKFTTRAQAEAIRGKVDGNNYIPGDFNYKLHAMFAKSNAKSRGILQTGPGHQYQMTQYAGGGGYGNGSGAPPTKRPRTNDMAPQRWTSHVQSSWQQPAAQQYGYGGGYGMGMGMGGMGANGWPAMAPPTVARIPWQGARPPDGATWTKSDKINQRLGNKNSNPACETLFASCIPRTITEDQIRDLFSSCDGFNRLNLRSKDFRNEHRQNIPGWMVFCDFDTMECAQTAREKLDGLFVPGMGFVNSGMVVSYARSKMGQKG